MAKSLSTSYLRRFAYAWLFFRSFVFGVLSEACFYRPATTTAAAVSFMIPPCTSLLSGLELNGLELAKRPVG
jgi:hypothetical protein